MHSILAPCRLKHAYGIAQSYLLPVFTCMHVLFLCVSDLIITSVFSNVHTPPILAATHFTHSKYMEGCMDKSHMCTESNLDSILACNNRLTVSPTQTNHYHSLHYKTNNFQFHFH